VPSQSFTATAIAAAPIDQVWGALDRPQTWESIGGVDRVIDPKIDETGRLRGFSFETVAAGRRYLGTATPAAREEGRVMAWNIANSEIRGVTTVELASSGEGTAITVRLDVESVGLMSGMFFPVIAGAIGNGLPTAVERFADGFPG
jgi:Polyketide cyclase / dehydrase and lipid transport